MVDPRFYPMPTRPKHHILRWVLLIFHIIPFAMAVFTHDSLVKMVDANLLNVGLLIWAVIIFIHLLLVLLLDAWESLKFNLRENERMHAYEEYHRKNLHQE